MNCPNCNAANPDAAKFCSNCGHALQVPCPNCATALPASAQFCFNCGHRMGASTPLAPAASGPLRQYVPPEMLARLESARSSGGMRGERRIVTMLFSDVKGSTAAAERLDPEDWAEIMNGAFERLMPPVYKYEGTLARLMGDAILAFFGAPIAHEDDPQRAVLAGLELLEALRPYKEHVKRRWGLDFDVRVGINTGLVVVGEVGSDLRVDYTALGDAVNVAARMEQTAEPGTVQIAEATHRQVAPLFDVEPLGAIEVKGRDQAVPAFRVLGAHARPGSLRGVPGLEAPLVGRAVEMNALWRAVDRLREGSGSVVSIMGEAGLGKSRLIRELREALAVEGQLPSDAQAPADNWPLAWHEGRAYSYQSNTPYAPFKELLGSMLGLPANESALPAYRAIQTQVAAAIPELTEGTAPFVASLIGVEPEGPDLERVRFMEPPHLRAGVFEAVRSIVEHLAARRPTVLVLEDVHWWDDTSLDLVEHLMPLTDTSQLMLLALFRPQRQEPSWRIHEAAERDYAHRYTRVALEPLSDEDSRELIADLLHIEGLPEKVRALILRKAEGNPFFVEEVIRSLIDSGAVVQDDDVWRATREIEDIAVPDTLASVLTTRLDRLGDAHKRVAQTAAVIGREFDAETLAAVASGADDLEGALRELLRRGLVRETARLPRRFYSFRHALTQEAAYGSLLLSARRSLHLRVAEHLERTEPAQAAQIASHFLEARVPVRALPHLVAAGEAAAKAYASADAIRRFKEAIAIVEAEASPDLALARRAYEGLGGAQTFAGQIPEAVATYQQMADFGERHGERPIQVSALNKRGVITALFMGQTDEGLRQLNTSEQIAMSCNDTPGLAEYHTSFCAIRIIGGDFDDAYYHLSEARRLGQEIGAPEIQLYGLTHSGFTYTLMAEFDKAREFSEQALQLAQETGIQSFEAEIRVEQLPLYQLRMGDLPKALQEAEAGIALSKRIGHAYAEGTGAFNAAFIKRLQGEYEQALAFYEQAIKAGQASGYMFLPASAVCGLAATHLEISTALKEQAKAYQEQALQMMQYPMGHGMGAFVWAESVLCAVLLGEPGAAEEPLEKGLTHANGARLLARPYLLAGGALMHAQLGRLAEATSSIADARAFSEERALRHTYPLIEWADGQVRLAAGNAGDALAAFERAEENASAMGMLPLLWQSQAGAAQALLALGRDAEATAKRDQARAVIDDIASRFTDERLRTLFVEDALAKTQAGIRSRH